MSVFILNDIYIGDGVITLQMCTSTITLNMHEYKYEYSENKLQLLYNVIMITLMNIYCF